MSAKTAKSWRYWLGQIHLWVGFILSVPLVLLGLSGSALVLTDMLPATSGGMATVDGGAPHPIAEILAAAQAAVPLGFVASLYFPAAHPGELASIRFTLSSRGAAGPGIARVQIDPVSLRILDSGDGNLLRFLHGFHASFLLSHAEGRQIVGIFGVAMLILGVTGLVNWWPRPGRWSAGFRIRRGARGLALHRDLHGVAGIWSLLIFLIVSFSGTYLAFPQTIGAGIGVILPARDLRSASFSARVEPREGVKPLTPDEAVALAITDAPGTRLSYVALPTRRDQPFRVALAQSNDWPGEPALVTLVDPWKRSVLERFDPRQFSAGETVLAWQHALHSGEGLGWLWRVAVFLIGFLPLGFAVTGISMWWRKRPKAVRAAIPVPSSPGRPER